MARPLRVGVQLPEAERDVRWPEYLSIARAVEELGFDSLWFGDHLLYRNPGEPERGPWDAWTMLAALAAVTERVALGPLVACAQFHRPGILARMAATVDELSGGRLVLGIGAGWNRPEFDAFGIDYGERAARFEEVFEIVRRLLAGEHVTFEGRFHRVRDAVLLPPPARRVPLMIGSSGPRVLRAALPHVDAWNTWYEEMGNTPEGFAELSAQVTKVAEEVGRDPGSFERSACVLVEVDPDAREWRVPEGLDPVRPDGLADHLRALAGAGADEAILVISPITEPAIRVAGEVLASLDASG
jgi:probable F420-dependent oxidoreductase